jgi:glycosyltransferase involved in cell wall biosynthesis
VGTVLHIVPDLGLNGAARQVSLLAPVHQRAGWDVHVAGVGGEGIFRRAFERLNVPVHRLVGSRSLDPRPWLELRRLVEEIRPDVIHAWRGQALKFASPVVRWLGRPSLVASDIASGAPPRWADRWMLQQAVAINVGTAAEQSSLVYGGVARERLTSIPFAVGSTSTVDRAALLRELGLPEHARLIACAGGIETGKGFREAVWLFDILKYIYPDFWLVLLGDGPDREGVENFSRSIALDDYRIRFAGTRDDAADLLGLAEIVWILGQRGGRNVALEAMAAGRPVVACDRPELREVLGSEFSEFFVANADRHELARATRRVLDNPSVQLRLGEFGLARAQEFAAGRVGELWMELYRKLADRHQPER